MFSPNFGIFKIFEQPERIRVSRDSIPNLFGRDFRFMQPFRLRKVSFLRTTIDGCTLDKYKQSSRTNFSRNGTSVKTGVSISFRGLLIRIDFNLWNDCEKPKKKKKKKLASTKIYILRKLKNKCCILVPKLPLIGNLMEKILKGNCPIQEFLSH